LPVDTNIDAILLLDVIAVVIRRGSRWKDMCALLIVAVAPSVFLRLSLNREYMM
jgi:hypothetical protein